MLGRLRFFGAQFNSLFWLLGCLSEFFVSFFLDSGCAYTCFKELFALWYILKKLVTCGVWSKAEMICNVA